MTVSPPNPTANEADVEPTPQPKLFTLKNLAIALVVLILGVVMAGASFYFRRTQLEQTRNFFGDDMIRAVQVAPVVFIEFPRDARGALDNDKAIEISSSPGLGMFRRALLDERHYDWTTAVEQEIVSLQVADPEFVLVDFSDDPARHPPDLEIPPIPHLTMLLEVSQGWVGIPGQAKMVRLTTRAQPAVRNFLLTREDVRSHPSR